MLIETTGQSVASTYIDNIVHTIPKSPLISQNPGPKDTCNRNRNTKNCDGPCYCTHVIDIKKDSVVEFVLYDQSKYAFKWSKNQKRAESGRFQAVSDDACALCERA